MARDYFKGKRFLITQSSLTQFAGSEIVALELASFLNEHSAKTTVFTWAYDGAIKSEFEKLNINVITNEEKLHLKDFDYIWVQHQVIPSSILKELTDSPSYPKPIFLFYHMATLSHIWIEQPYANTIEKDLSSSSLFVSTEALEKNTTLFSNLFHNPQVFPNFIPQHFLSKEEASNTLKKILVVSNHPPQELIDSIQLLSNQGIQVDLLGRNSDHYQLTTPTLLKKYDLVITIGKTVQYCLGMNIPVYIYDMHGGCGFLNSRNYNKAKNFNFSGRPFKKKTPQQIATEITTQFQSAISFQTKNYDKNIIEFNLEQNLAKVLKEAKHRNHKFSRSQINQILSIEQMAKDKIILSNQNKSLVKENQFLKTQATASKEQVIDLQNSIFIMQNSRLIKAANFLHSLNTHQKHHPHPEIILVLCLYNESQNLPTFLKYVSKYIDGIVAIDDNSSDDTVKLLKKNKKNT